jgi:hypothetical protein
MDTLTSSNGTLIGASGLRIVTSAEATGSYRRHTPAIRSGDSRDQIHRIGLPRCDDRLGKFAVVDRPRSRSFASITKN